MTVLRQLVRDQTEGPGATISKEFFTRSPTLILCGNLVSGTGVIAEIEYEFGDGTWVVASPEQSISLGVAGTIQSAAFQVQGPRWRVNFNGSNGQARVYVLEIAGGNGGTNAYAIPS